MPRNASVAGRGRPAIPTVWLAADGSCSITAGSSAAASDARIITATLMATTLNNGRIIGDIAGLPLVLILLLDLAVAIDDEMDFLAVFHSLDGDAFGGGFAFADLRIAGVLKLADEFLLRQRVGGDEHANRR